MCDGVTVVKTMTEQLGRGYVLEAGLVDTCDEHEGRRIGIAGIFSPNGSVVETLGPTEFSRDDDGIIRFSDLVTTTAMDARLIVEAFPNVLGL